MKLKKGSAAAKAYMAKIRAKRNTKKVGSIKNNIIEFSDGYKFKKVSKDYAAKNFNKIEIFGIDLSNESESLIESKNDLNSFNTFGIEFKTTKKVGSTLKLKANEKRLGATLKDVKTRSKSYHKDTKSHNVNIRVISGFSKFVKHKGFTIDVIKLANNKKEYAVYQVSPTTNKEVYYGSYATLKAAKEWINRSLYLLKNSLK
jgi:hypothetical protein